MPHRKKFKKNRQSVGWGIGQVLLALLAGVGMNFLLHETFTGHADALLTDLDHLAWAAVVVLTVILFVHRTHKQQQLTISSLEAAREHSAYLESQARLHELSSLFQTVAGWNTELPLPSLLDLITYRLAASLRAQQVSIMLLDEETEELRTAASYGVESQFARNARQKVGEGIAGQVARDCEPRLVTGRADEASGQDGSRAGRNITSALCAPLLDGERVRGVLNVNRIQFPEDFSQDHLNIVSVFGCQLGVLVGQLTSVRAAHERASNLEQELVAVSGKMGEVGRLRDLFLATASHEFKTPVAVIQGAADMLLDSEGRGLDPDQAQEILIELKGAADQLTSLVGDVVDLANIETGRITLHMESMDLNQLVQNTLDTLRPIAARYGISLEESYDPDLPRIQADRLKLRHPFVQLLSGILRITEESGHVRLRTSHREGDVMLEITSTGPITLTDAERALGLFGQTAIRAKQSVSGMGVGFDLIRRLLELHSGRITARNADPDGGLVVEVLLRTDPDLITVVQEAA